MDIGQAGHAGYAGYWYCENEGEGRATEYRVFGEVIAVGKGSGKYFRCGGSGDMARECPTLADKGEGHGGGFDSGFNGNGYRGWLERKR